MNPETKSERNIVPPTWASVNQIKAASYTLQVIQKTPIVSRDESLRAVAETDIFRLRRGLCLPCAVATCINLTAGKRIIGDQDGKIKVGSIYQAVLPFHNKTDLTSIDGEKINHPWWVVTQEGDMYHHAVLAFALGLGISAQEISGFGSVDEFQNFLRQPETSIAISLDNHFVIEQTLGNNPNMVVKDVNGEARILIEGPMGTHFRQFENGRHVVALTYSSKPNHVIVIDSFLLPQQKPNSNTMLVPTSLIDLYLQYKTGGKTRAIAFARQPNLFSCLPHKIINPKPMRSVPREVVAKVSELFGHYHQTAHASST